MPHYLFKCQPTLGGCGHQIEFDCLISALDTTQPKSCPTCHKRKSLQQVLFPPTLNIPVTLGSLADKNTGNMSADEKHHLTEQFTAYKKQKKSWESTDKGMVHT